MQLNYDICNKTQTHKKLGYPTSSSSSTCLNTAPNTLNYIFHQIHGYSFTDRLPGAHKLEEAPRGVNSVQCVVSRRNLFVPCARADRVILHGQVTACLHLMLHVHISFFFYVCIFIYSLLHDE